MPANRNNRSKSCSNTFATGRITFETLEPRQMMSAVTHADSPHFNLKSTPPALFADRVQLQNHKSVGPSRSPGAEPAVDGNVTGWVNVSRLPLFSSAGASPMDVRQGAVGDCFFLASLASTASQDPGLIRQEVSERQDGTYDAFFWNSSGRQWVDEHVDGYLPVNRSGRLEYAQLGQGNATWVAIMEKGFACFRYSSYGASYTYLNNGWPSEALRDLGASNLNDYNLKGMQSGFNLALQVYNDLSAGRAVEVSTASTSGPLVGLHVYSVMSVYQNSAGYTYLLVRNPWGTDGPNHNGYQWVSTDALLPQLSDVVSALI